MQWLPIFLLLVAVGIVLYYVMNQPTSSSPSPAVVPESSSSPSPPPVSDAAEMLKTFYVPAQEKVALDYPPKGIGCCPFSRPMSTDLPIGNLPMCYAVASQTHLSKEI